MKFGMNLLLWSDDIHDDMLPVLEKIKEKGFDGVEVPVFDLNLDKWQTWANRLDDLGLERTAVTVCNEEANPISQDPEIRSRGVDMLKQTLDCCQALGAYSLNGPLHSGLGIFSGKGPTEGEWEYALELRDQHKNDPLTIEAGHMVSEYFSAPERLGMIRLRESHYYRPELQIGKFMSVLQELFPLRAEPFSRAS